MSRNYYCDYCEKSFFDDLYSRKRHLASAQHQRLRYEYYESIKSKESRQKISEELNKQPCSQFIKTGVCLFGNACKFSHYSQEELWALKMRYDEIDKQKQQELEKEEKFLSEATIENFTDNEKFQNQQCKKQDPLNLSYTWAYPTFLYRLNLPISLREFRQEDFKDFSFNFEEWG